MSTAANSSAVGTSARAAPGTSARPAAGWRLAAWRSLLRAHAHLLIRLEQDLSTAGMLPLASYDVLVQLAEAPESRLRMAELADAVLLSRSGLTRLVDRLQKQGLVERQLDDSDARGLYAVMTPAGREALSRASKVHLAGVSELVLDRLDDDELRQLRYLMDKIDPRSDVPADS